MSRLVSIAALLAMTATAQAHIGIGATTGFAHGFLHPLGGIDHVLAMVAVGLLAAHLGGRALWLVPTSFLAMMALGSVIALAGYGLPLVEIGIGLSVVVLGIAVGTGRRISTLAAMALVGFFAIFHGHAHGAEMPLSAAGSSYGLGFLLATAALHGCGIGLGLLLANKTRILQAAGSAIAVVGVAILAGLG